MYYQLFDLFSLVVTTIICLHVLLHFNKFLIACEIIVDILLHSVQTAFNQVIMKVNGGYEYVKKQRNHKRPRARQHG